MSFRERYLNQQMLLEVSPAVVFFVSNYFGGLMVATAAVMAATTITTILGFRLNRSVPVLPLVTLCLVLFLGGATLALGSEAFIKIRPTLGSLLFAGALALGLLLQRSLLERVLDARIDLTRRGWHILTWRWVAVAVLGALVNEIARRNFSTDTWVLVHTLDTPVSILLYVSITRITAPRYRSEAIDQSDVGTDQTR